MADTSLTISLTVNFRADPPRVLSVAPDTSYANFQSQLEELTGVPPHLQKLLYKGKKSAPDDPVSVSLDSVGLKDGTVIKMLGSTQAAVDSMLEVEKEKKRREDIIRERSTRGPTKVTSIHDSRI